MGQSFNGRLWDTLYNLLVVIKQSKNPCSVLEFPVLYVLEGEEKLVTLKGVMGPGDRAEAVMTIMLPHED